MKEKNEQEHQKWSIKEGNSGIGESGEGERETTKAVEGKRRKRRIKKGGREGEGGWVEGWEK